MSVANLLYIAAGLEVLPTEFFRDITPEDLDMLPPKPATRPGRKKRVRRKRRKK